MPKQHLLGYLVCSGQLFCLSTGAYAIQANGVLPTGVKADWELNAAYRERTPTRERICINGLWRWQPAADASTVPSDKWGYFKVPGCWPGISDYLQKDCQTVFPDPSWKSANMGAIRSAWYQREVTIPPMWKGRRITLSAEYVNSFAAVYVDGKKAGDIRFPAGSLDLTSVCRPGIRHVLSIHVTAAPLKAVMLSYTDTNAAREVKGSVARRGLCGDLFLESTPRGARVTDVKVDTSVQRGEISYRCALDGLSKDAKYRLLAEVRDTTRVVRSFTSPPFRAADLRDGRMTVIDKWRAQRLWDIHTPHNQFSVQITLQDSRAAADDTTQPIRFGYREFWINGRDFYLNGSRIYLSSVPLDNAQVGAAWSTYAGAKESLERLKSFGINFVYTHNYDCEPGSHLSFTEIMRAADDVGMLVVVSQPHFSAYNWKSPDAERTNGYARHAEFYTGVAGNHPSVVAYAMSHNACSYDEAKNPDKIDGLFEERDNWALNNVKQALRAEALVKRLDPARIVYHHSSGNLGSMYTENFYVNFAPKQELSDWFEHWATKGVKPLFLCEYCAPSTWDWTMYRGWFKGKREWGSAQVPWDFEIAEWNAQFVGDRAYKISEAEKRNLRWEAQQYRTKEGWYRWDYPSPVGSDRFDERNEVFAAYIEDNWRAYRTWGVSAFVPWEYEFYWKLQPSADRSRKALPVDWDHLQRPGYSPDFIDSQYESMNLSYKRGDWVPNAAGEALIRNNRPLLAYIGGKASKFTSKDHTFRAGDKVEKQVIVINNARLKVTGEYKWTLGTLSGAGKFEVTTGNQVRLPFTATLPQSLAPGAYKLSVSVRFNTGEVQDDTFNIEVVPAIEPLKMSARIALFDPKGETRKLLDGMGVTYQTVDANADLSRFDMLVIGKGAITLNGQIPDVKRVRDGLKVIVFEQTAEVLEQRMGFRVAEYGLRQVFPRVNRHPILAGLSQETLRDWTGEATTSTPRLKYTLKPMYGPMVKWCGIDLPHVWRCGCQGNVASVLIEKPARGDFLPIVDGGYSLQYSPLMQYREGSGTILFCQMDVTGRTENDSAALRLAQNILQFVTGWKPSPQSPATYAGNEAGKDQLIASGISLVPYNAPRTAGSPLLVLGPAFLDGISRPDLSNWVFHGGRVLSVGLDESAIVRELSPRFQVKRREYIGADISPQQPDSWLAGIAPADLHIRDPREMAVVAAGADVIADGVLARDGNLSFCQIAPWQFDPKKAMNQKRTFRRTSFLLTRLLCNLGVACSSPLLDDIAKPVNGDEKRWLHGLYLDTPEEWDDPYRFFGW